VAPIERPGDDYELLDAGAGRRLERFGDHLVDRPYPAAILSPEAPELWRDADLSFDRDTGWTGERLHSSAISALTDVVVARAAT